MTVSLPSARGFTVPRTVGLKKRGRETVQRRSQFRNLFGSPARLNNIALDASPLYQSACFRLARRREPRRLNGFCLLAGVARRIHLGRRSIRHPQLFADRFGRVAPNLVFPRRTVPIFSVDLHGLTNRTLALGSKSRRISFGKYSASPWQWTSRVVHPCAPESSRCMVGSGNIRV